MSPIQRFYRSDAGGIGILGAILLPVLMAGTALAIEVGHWYLDGRAMQGAADAAAISAGASYVAGEQGYIGVGQNFAGRNGFQDGINQVTVVVNPIDEHNRITVDIWRAETSVVWPIPVHLTPVACGAVSSTHVCVRAHAAVTLSSGPSSGNGCLIGLSRSTTISAITIGGNGDINASGCVAASNSCGGAAPDQCMVPGLGFNGNAQASLAELDTATQNPFACPAGTAGTTCNIGVSKTLYPLWTRDPFALYAMPAPGPCTDPAPAHSLGVTTYRPGTYCNGISIAGQQNVVFSPGLYFLVNSSFSVTGGAVNQRSVASASLVSSGNNAYKNNDVVTVSGGTAVFPATIKLKVQGGSITGVSVVNGGAYMAPLPANPVATTGGNGIGATFNLTFAPDPGPNQVSFLLTGATPGTVQIKNAPVTLTASTGGPANGLIFWQDKNAAAGGGTFNGDGQPTTALSLTGSLYFPSQLVTIAGNSVFLPTECTSIVANLIDFQGLGTITKGCLPTSSGGGRTITGLVRLSE